MNKVEPIRDKKDIEAIKAALHGRDRLLFIMGVSLGLRITDLLSLKIGDVRGKERITVKEEKTSKNRPIKLSQTVKAEVMKLDGDDSEYIFKSRKGNNKPITRVQAYRILNDAAIRAGVKDKIGAFGCHSLRKSFGFQLHQKGYDITRIMTILQHSSPEITLAYIGITDQEIDEAYEAIEV
jgi:integrase